jgi:ATP-dependent helicase/nuclease subunit A
VSLTPEQSQAAYADVSVAVTAGAGTGKTHMLASRFLHHVKTGLSPLEIVAVTFTERAAAELRARIRHLAQTELPTRLDAQVELESAQISTIHALAARICRDHPDEAQVPPDFVILDELEGVLWKAEQLEQALVALPETIYETISYIRLREVLAALLDDPITASKALMCAPEHWPAIVNAARAEAVTQVTSMPEWHEGKIFLKAQSGPPTDKGEQARCDCLEAIAAFEEGQAEQALECVKRFRTNAGTKTAWNPEILEGLRYHLKNIKGLITDACNEEVAILKLGSADEELAALLPHLQQTFKHVQKHLGEAKRRARVLDFSDLEVHALKALEHKSVQQHYAKRWQAILIDEFQDTNPVQAAILNRLMTDMTLTIVGDEKQSIYGFRGAEISVFKRFREQITQVGGSEVIMRTSFRTHHQLVASTNSIFTETLGSMHQDLQASRHESPLSGPYVSLHVVQAEPGVSKPQRQVSEARAIGELIRELVESNVLVHDKPTNTLRSVGYGDVAVLTRTSKPLITYSEVLPGLGVPAVHTGGGNLLESREAKDAFACLRFLSDPSDNLALAALLRSPLFHIDDTSLYQFAQDIPEGSSWWEGLAQHLHTFEHPHYVLKTLLDLKYWILPSRLLQLLDKLTGYSAVLANLPGSIRRLADWRGMLDLTRELEAGMQDLFTVVRRLKRLQQAEVEVPRPTLYAENAVALMTIHKSKGLEWPIVIVADLDSDATSRAPNILFDAELGLGLRLEDDDGNSDAPVLYTLLRHKRKMREEAEARRVLYVACTRARDRLFLTATEARRGSLKMLASGLKKAGIPMNVIPHNPTEATYPSPPIPSQPQSRLTHEGVSLWDQSPEALGELAQYLEKPTLPNSIPTDKAGAWDEVFDIIDLADNEWQPLAKRLCQAGVPSPDPNKVMYDLTTSGQATNYLAVMTWAIAKGELALVDNATPDQSFDQELLRVDPNPDEQEFTKLLNDLDQKGVLLTNG